MIKSQFWKHPKVEILSQDPEEAPPIIAIENGNDHATFGTEDKEELKPEAPPIITIKNGNDHAGSGTEDEKEPKPETLDHHDLPALHRAKAELEVRHKKKNLNLFFRV